jgi:hypothetical protein
VLLILSAILNVNPFPLIAYRVLRLSTIFSSAMIWSIQTTYYSLQHDLVEKLDTTISMHYKLKLVDGVKMFLEFQFVCDNCRYKYLPVNVVLCATGTRGRSQMTAMALSRNYITHEPTPNLPLFIRAAMVHHNILFE